MGKETIVLGSPEGVPKKVEGDALLEGNQSGKPRSLREELLVDSEEPRKATPEEMLIQEIDLADTIESFGNFRGYISYERGKQEDELDDYEDRVESMSESELEEMKTVLKKKGEVYENYLTAQKDQLFAKERAEFDRIDGLIKGKEDVLVKGKGVTFKELILGLKKGIVEGDNESLKGFEMKMIRFHKQINKLLEYNHGDKYINDSFFSMDDLEGFGDDLTELSSGELEGKGGEKTLDSEIDKEQNDSSMVYDGFDQKSLIYLDGLFRSIQAIDTQAIDLEQRKRTDLFTADEISEILFNVGIDQDEAVEAFKSIPNLINVYKGQDPSKVKIYDFDKKNIEILQELLKLNKLKTRRLDILEGLDDLPEEKIGSLSFGPDAFKLSNPSRNLNTLL